MSSLSVADIQATVFDVDTVSQAMPLVEYCVCVCASVCAGYEILGRSWVQCGGFA